jgi:hypothetical protein
MLKRLLGPDRRTATSLSRETGIAQVTLSRWKRESRTLGFVSIDKSNQSKKKRSRRTAADRLRILTEAASLSGDELGALLRREGLHSDELERWRTQALQSLEADRRGRRKSPEQKELQTVRRELRRKEKALAEAAALLVLKKSPGDLGGLGRRHGRENRQLILSLIDEAVQAGARRAPACEVIGLSARVVERWRREDGGEDRRLGPC